MYERVQVGDYASKQVCKYAHLQVCKQVYIYMHVWKSSSIQVYTNSAELCKGMTRYYAKLYSVMGNWCKAIERYSQTMTNLSKFWSNMSELCKLSPDILKSCVKPDMTKTCKKC